MAVGAPTLPRRFFLTLLSHTPSAHGQALARAFTARPDLRPAICLTLTRLADQASSVARGAAADDGDDSDADADDDDDETTRAAADPGAHTADGAPTAYTPSVAAATLAVLGAQACHWFPLLLNWYVSCDPADRAPPARAAAALAAAAPPAAAAAVFTAALAKLAAATRDAAADPPPPPGRAADGGDAPAARRVTFLGAAAALAPGADDAALAALWDAALAAAGDREAAVQKAAYRALARVARRRSAWLDTRLDAALAGLVAAAPSAAPSAKRHRLAVLAAAVPAAGQAGRSFDPARGGDAAALLAEIVLSVKEPNARTRAAGYDLLVELGAPDESAADPDAAHAPLRVLTAAVLAGVAAGTPHHASASVMALARLLHEYPGPMAGDGGRLLPALLPLLRSKSRESVKAALGFAKVAASRLPPDALTPTLPALMHALLAWSDDPKNKFRLRVRLVVERLARRLGADVVAKAMPPGDARLLAHIRKQTSRRDRKRAATQASDDEDDDYDDAGEQDARSRGRTARTGAAKSAWAHTALFSEGATTKRPPGSKRATNTAAGRRLPGDDGADPLDLLSGGAARALAAGRGGGGRRAEDADDARPLSTDPAGRLVVFDDEPKKQGRAKRGRGGDDDGFDSGDSDFEELGAAARDARAGWAATAGAASLAGRAAAAAARSEGGRTARTARTARSGGTTRSGRGGGRNGPTHGADRFAAKKGGAGGDVKRGAVEPYAYWPLDRKMLNRRPAKQRDAKGGLASVVHARGAKRVKR